MKIRILLFLLVLAAGCWETGIETQKISVAELDDLKCKWQDPKMSQWFYVGSEVGYHMFLHRDLPGDKYYEVKMTDYKIDSPQVIVGDQSK